MPEYRVEFPDGEAWKINVKGKKGDEALKSAWQRAATARAVDGKESAPFEECVVRKMTAKLRAELKGMTYLDSSQMLATCLQIAHEYQRKGLALTVRGMYYQLVSRGYLPSGQKEYNRVKNLLANERLRGNFPLDILSDSSRTLRPGDSTRYDLDPAHAITQAESWIPQLDRFFLQAARWYRQPNLPIVLFEKEALSNVFGPTCRQLGVPWMATKGYPSVSTLHEIHKMMARSCDPHILRYDLYTLDYEHLQELDPLKRTATKGEDFSEYEMLLHGHQMAVEALQSELEYEGFWVDEYDEETAPTEHHRGERFRYRYGDLTATEWHQGTAQTLRLLYFGDHDPDGMEIPNDLERRLRIIQVRTNQIIPFTIERLGLNRDQIEQYNPPPFWAKASSSRHALYVQNHPWAQNNAWELDALDPTVLRQITEDSVNGYFDQDIHDEVQDAVSRQRDEFNERMQRDVLPGMIE